MKHAYVDAEQRWEERKNDEPAPASLLVQKDDGGGRRVATIAVDSCEDLHKAIKSSTKTPS